MKRQEKDQNYKDKDDHKEQDANCRSAAVIAVAQVPHQIDENNQKLQGLCEYVEEEEEFVFFADAGAEPGTVVVEGSDALFAGVAVSHPQRLVKFTDSAVSFGLVHEIDCSLRLVWLRSYLFM